MISRMTHPYILPVYPLILMLGFYGDVFISGDRISMHDTINPFGAFSYFVLCLAEGHLPLWDPYSFSGAPFYMNYNIVFAMDPTVLITVPLVSFFDISTLSLYHFHVFFREVIIYTGCYALFNYITKNKWAALFGSTLALFVILPNILWQMYSIILATYVPWITLFMLQMLSPESSTRLKRLSLFAACYLIGLSFNTYLPSNLFFYLSIALIYILISRPSMLKKAFKEIGLRYVGLGLILLVVMGGPFLFALFKFLSPNPEDMSLRRFSYQYSVKSETKVHALSFTALSNPPQYGVNTHHLLSLLAPGPDKTFFHQHMFGVEVFITFGLFPLVAILLFFFRSKCEYKGLFLFLAIMMGLIMQWPGHMYREVFQYYPGIKSITQFHLFLGFFIESICALFAIAFAEFLKLIAEKNKESGPSVHWVTVIIVGHLIALYFYLRDINRIIIESNSTWSFGLNFSNNMAEHGWTFVATYCLLALFLSRKGENFRSYICFALVGVTLYQVLVFITVLKPYVTQPAGPARGYVHHKRDFVYSPVRVPYVPRHTVFWLYTSSIYGVFSAIPTHFNQYNVMGRRTFDLMRFTSAERQGFLNGIGARRFGFYDNFVIAENGDQALDYVGRMPMEALQNTLVLEEDPKIIQPDVEGLTRIPKKSIILEKDLTRSTHQFLKDYYQNIDYVDYSKSYETDERGFLKIKLPSDHSAFDWPWDSQHIGYFHVLFGSVFESKYYNPFSYYPTPGIRTGYDGKKNLICNSNYLEWTGRQALPGFYGRSIDDIPFTCDIVLKGDEIWISPELQGAYYTDDVTGPDKDKITTGFYIASLDPKKVTPEKSPYPRDELTKVVNFGPNFITFQVNNRKPGLFYYADSYAKYWKAYIDDVPTHIYRANFNNKAVYVPAGEHQVTMKFQPDFFIFLLILFGMVSILGMGLFAYVLMLEKKERKPSCMKTESFSV